MANTFCGVQGSAAFTDNTTRYVPIVGGLPNNLTTEAEAQTPVRDAGTFKNGFAYATANDLSNTATITLRKSTADTALILSYTAGQTGVKQDTSNQPTFANTDEVNWEVTVPTEGGTHTITLSLISVEFAPDTSSNSVSFIAATGSAGYSTASTTFYQRVVGLASGNFATTESHQKLRIRGSFTASDFYTYVSANARTTDTVCKTRKGGADGGQSVTYTSGQTGAKEDTSGSDSLSAGDDFNYSITTSTNTGTITFKVMSCSLISTGGQFLVGFGSGHAGGAGPGGGGGIGSGATIYAGASGGVAAFTTTEVNAQSQPQFNFTAKELVTYVVNNGNSSGDCVLRTRDNGSNGAQSVTYTPGQTGLKNDSSNTDTITGASDEINYQGVNSGDSGVDVAYLAILGETAAGVTPDNRDIIMRGVIVWHRTV